jgi:outer membrane lipoprotein SlyB
LSQATIECRQSRSGQSEIVGLPELGSAEKKGLFFNAFVQHRFSRRHLALNRNTRSFLMFQFLKRFAALVAVAALAACAGQQTMPAYNGFGVVNGISEAQVSGSGGTMAGGVGGALVGGALGSLIGGGTGKTIATGVGAVAGGMAGSNAGGRADTKTVWDVSVRCEDGIDRVVRTDVQPFYRPGTRVRLVNGMIQPL